MGPIRWVASGGGPLIVVPVEVARHWRGDEAIWPLTGGLGMIWEAVRNDSDYGRACRVDGYLGVLDVGPGSCLILGDDPMQTTYLRTNDGGLIVRWSFAECEEDVVTAARSVPEDTWEKTTHRIEIADGGLLIFDSAYPGDDLPTSDGDGANVPWLKFALPKGGYEIDTCDHEPDDLTHLILHRLRLSDSEVVRAPQSEANRPGSR